MIKNNIIYVLNVRKFASDVNTVEYCVLITINSVHICVF